MDPEQLEEIHMKIGLMTRIAQGRIGLCARAALALVDDSDGAADTGLIDQLTL